MTPTNRTKLLQIRLTEKEMEYIQLWAKEADQPVSWFMRSVIKYWKDGHQKKNGAFQ